MISSVRCSIVHCHLSRHRDALRRPSDDAGNAIVEFALVVPILLAVALAVLQIALALHIRATLTSAAAEGARTAALAGSDLGAGERRTRDILATTIGSQLVDAVSVRREWREGALVVAVGIDATLPVLGLLGPSAMHVDGHALQEQV